MSEHSTTTPIVMTVAGSDSGGGAGIQADIKAISATGSYACSVITALTAQNTQGVSGIYPVAGSFIRQQFDAVYRDLAVDVVKVGMLGDVATIETVVQALKDHNVQRIVLDPVMVAASGDLLLAPEAVDCLVEQLLPMASIITPNYLEAQALLKRELTPHQWPDTMADLQHTLATMSEALRQLGCNTALVKAPSAVMLDGKLQMVDQLATAAGQQSFAAPYIKTNNTHGTGCTMAAAIASFWAQQYALEQAVEHAKQYTNRAIAHSHQIHIGKGRGPVHHFFKTHAAKGQA